MTSKETIALLFLAHEGKVSRPDIWESWRRQLPIPLRDSILFFMLVPFSMEKSLMPELTPRGEWSYIYAPKALPLTWGGVTTVRAIQYAMKQILKNPSIQEIVLLSNSELPQQSALALLKLLKQSDYRTRMCADPRVENRLWLAERAGFQPKSEEDKSFAQVVSHLLGHTMSMSLSRRDADYLSKLHLEQWKPFIDRYMSLTGEEMKMGAEQTQRDIAVMEQSLQALKELKGKDFGHDAQHEATRETLEYALANLKRNLQIYSGYPEVKYPYFMPDEFLFGSLLLNHLLKSGSSRTTDLRHLQEQMKTRSGCLVSSLKPQIRIFERGDSSERVGRGESEVRSGAGTTSSIDWGSGWAGKGASVSSGSISDKPRETSSHMVKLSGPVTWSFPRQSLARALELNPQNHFLPQKVHFASSEDFKANPHSFFFRKVSPSYDVSRYLWT